MGIIERQATRSVIYSYLGAGLGFLTVIWTAHILNPDENGLTRVIVAIAMLLSQFSGLGFNAVTMRFFPYFRDKEKGHHGFLFYGIITTLLGFVVCYIFYLCFKQQIIESNEAKSGLFVEYIFYLMPLTFFMLFFNLFDYYLRACFSSVIGASSKDLTQRVLILLCMFLYFLKLIDFEWFVFLYIVSTCLPTLILLYYIIKLDEWHIKPVKGFIKKELKGEMIKLALYSVLAGGTGVLIANVDILIVNQKLGLTQTGIYGIAFYFGTIIIIPSRSLARIATSIVSEAFKRNDLIEINDLYRKSCNTQLVIGLLLFMGIWINIDSIMQLLPVEYAEGKNVILFIGLGYLIDMGTGINFVILLTSKEYRFDSYFMFITLALTVITNYMLIPIYGITGSAIATAITLGTNNIMRWLFLFFKFKMQPYDFNIVKILLIAVAAFLPGYFIPKMPYWIVDVAVRSMITGGLFLILLLKTEASPEINFKIRKNLKRFSINI